MPGVVVLIPRRVTWTLVTESVTTCVRLRANTVVALALLAGIDAVMCRLPAVATAPSTENIMETRLVVGAETRETPVVDGITASAVLRVAGAVRLLPATSPLCLPPVRS